MEDVLEIVAYALKLIGVLFLLVAAVGVMRLPDAFTRMHAATKAGTLGAGMVVLGSALSVTGGETIALALLTVVILLATVPLASHLLGRAAYVSGAPFWRGTARDALEGKLSRGPALVEPDAAPALVTAPFPLARVVVAPTHEADGASAARAVEVAEALGVPLTVLGLIDGARLTGPERAHARERLEALLARVRKTGDVAAIETHEDAPDAVLRAIVAEGDLTVLPGVGWFDHGTLGPDLADRASGADPASGRAPSTLSLAQGLPRPVLIAGERGTVGRVTVLDDGSPSILRGLATLTDTPLFEGARIRITWPSGATMTPERRAELAAAAYRPDLGFQAPGASAGAVRDPGDVLVCHRVPGAGRGDWYGTDWHDRVAPGWRGGVLLV